MSSHAEVAQSTLGHRQFYIMRAELSKDRRGYILNRVIDYDARCRTNFIGGETNSRHTLSEACSLVS
jgi:hypothetical protein